jgi:hypothetical protein
MKLTWEHEAAADREHQHRVYLEAQEALEAKEAADAIDYDALGIPEPVAIAAPGRIAAPIADALDGWLRGISAARKVA